MSTVKETVKNNLPAPVYNVLREGRDVAEFIVEIDEHSVLEAANGRVARV